MSKLFIFLETVELKKYSGILYFLFAPIFLILEFITYKNYWKIILTELIETNQLMDWLLKNEFGLNKGRLIKKDLYDDNQFYASKSDREAKDLMKKEFVEKLDVLISKFTSINIENYLTLIVETETKTVKFEGDTYQRRIYTVFIQYCRYFQLIKILKKSIYWLIVTIIIFLSILLFIL